MDPWYLPWELVESADDGKKKPPSDEKDRFLAESEWRTPRDPRCQRRHR